MTDLAATGGIDAATINGKALLAALTGAATLAAGAMLYGQGTTQPATLAAGTSGYVLTANGAAAPAWTNIYGQANTWTAAQTIDRGTGALPASFVAATNVITLATASNNTNIEAYGFGGTAFSIYGRSIGGTRASVSATTDFSGFINLAAGGYDGTAHQVNAATYSIRADGLWSGTNRGALHLWTGTPNGSTTSAEWMRLQNGNLGIGVTPTSGAKFQLGTGQSNGIGFQSGGTLDTFLYRDSAAILAMPDGNTLSVTKTGFKLTHLGTATGNYAAIDFFADGSLNGSLFTASAAHSATYDRLNLGAISAHGLAFITNNTRRIRIGSAGELHFSGGTPVSKPTASGSRGGNAALASLLTGLANLGLITDSTTA